MRLTLSPDFSRPKRSARSLRVAVVHVVFFSIIFSVRATMVVPL